MSHSNTGRDFLPTGMEGQAHYREHCTQSSYTAQGYPSVLRPLVTQGVPVHGENHMRIRQPSHVLSQMHNAGQSVTRHPDAALTSSLWSSRLQYHPHNMPQIRPPGLHFSRVMRGTGQYQTVSRSTSSECQQSSFVNDMRETYNLFTESSKDMRESDVSELMMFRLTPHHRGKGVACTALSPEQLYRTEMINSDLQSGTRSWHSPCTLSTSDSFQHRPSANRSLEFETKLQEDQTSSQCPSIAQQDNLRMHNKDTVSLKASTTQKKSSELQQQECSFPQHNSTCQTAEPGSQENSLPIPSSTNQKTSTQSQKQHFPSQLSSPGQEISTISQADGFSQHFFSRQHMHMNMNIQHPNDRVSRISNSDGQISVVSQQQPPCVSCVTSDVTGPQSNRNDSHKDDVILVESDDDDLYSGKEVPPVGKDAESSLCDVNREEITVPDKHSPFSGHQQRSGTVQSVSNLPVQRTVQTSNPLTESDEVRDVNTNEEYITPALDLSNDTVPEMQADVLIEAHGKTTKSLDNCVKQQDQVEAGCSCQYSNEINISKNVCQTSEPSNSLVHTTHTQESSEMMVRDAASLSEQAKASFPKSSEAQTLCKLSTESYYRCGCLSGRCGFHTVLPTQLKLHLQEVHPDTDTYPCVHCGSQENGLDHFMCHLEEHLNQTLTLYCSDTLCEFSSVSLEEVLNHMGASHTGLSNLVCWRCSSTFSSYKEFSIHIKQNLLSVNKCHHCSAKDVNRQAVVTHMISSHPDQGRMIGIKKVLLCQERKMNCWGVSDNDNGQTIPNRTDIIQPTCNISSEQTGSEDNRKDFLSCQSVGKLEHASKAKHSQRIAVISPFNKTVEEVLPVEREQVSGESACTFHENEDSSVNNDTGNEQTLSDNVHGEGQGSATVDFCDQKAYSLPGKKAIAKLHMIRGNLGDILARPLNDLKETDMTADQESDVPRTEVHGVNDSLEKITEQETTDIGINSTDKLNEESIFERGNQECDQLQLESRQGKRDSYNSVEIDTLAKAEDLWVSWTYRQNKLDRSSEAQEFTCVFCSHTSQSVDDHVSHILEMHPDQQRVFDQVKDPDHTTREKYSDNSGKEGEHEVGTGGGHEPKSSSEHPADLKNSRAIHNISSKQDNSEVLYQHRSEILFQSQDESVDRIQDVAFSENPEVLTDSDLNPEETSPKSLVDLSLRDHEKQQCKKMRYQCRFCSYLDSSPSRVCKHIYAEHKSLMKCPRCSVLPINDRDLYSHLSVEHAEEKDALYCLHKSQNWISSFKLNEDNSNPADVHEPIKLGGKQNKNELMHCKLCTFSSPLSPCLHDHIFTEHQDMMRCPKCSVVLTSDESFCRHLSDAHAEEKDYLYSQHGYRNFIQSSQASETEKKCSAHILEQISVVCRKRRQSVNMEEQMECSPEVPRGGAVTSFLSSQSCQSKTEDGRQHASGLIQCRLCSFSSNRHKDMYSHIFQEHKEVQCPVCTTSVSNVTEQRTHLKKQHPDQEKVLLAQIKPQNFMSCLSSPVKTVKKEVSVKRKKLSTPAARCCLQLQSSDPVDVLHSEVGGSKSAESSKLNKVDDDQSLDLAKSEIVLSVTTELDISRPITTVSCDSDKMKHTLSCSQPDSAIPAQKADPSLTPEWDKEGMEYRCPHCTSDFKQRYKLYEHLCYHYHYRCFKCSRCPFLAFSRSSVNNHCTKTHKEKPDVQHLIKQNVEVRIERAILKAYVAVSDPYSEKRLLAYERAKQKKMMKANVKREKKVNKLDGKRKISKEQTSVDEKGLLRKQKKPCHTKSVKKLCKESIKGSIQAEKKWLKCPYCRAGKKSQKAVECEIRNHIHYKPFCCPFCKFPSGSEVRVKKHIAEKHPGKQMRVRYDRIEQKEEKFEELLRRAIALSGTSQLSNQK